MCVCAYVRSLYVRLHRVYVFCAMICVCVCVCVCLCVFTQEKSGIATRATVMQKGRKLYGAGYCLYGAATMLVLSTGHGTCACVQ